MDVWPIITGESDKTPHDEIVLGYDFDNKHPNQGAFISGNYKLIVGAQEHGCDSSHLLIILVPKGKMDLTVMVIVCITLSMIFIKNMIFPKRELIMVATGVLGKTMINCIKY